MGHGIAPSRENFGFSKECLLKYRRILNSPWYPKCFLQVRSFIHTCSVNLYCHIPKRLRVLATENIVVVSCVIIIKQEQRKEKQKKLTNYWKLQNIMAFLRKCSAEHNASNSMHPEHIRRVYFLLSSLEQTRHFFGGFLFWHLDVNCTFWWMFGWDVVLTQSVVISSKCFR